MIALFDLDDTLLRGDSNHRWGELLVDLGVLDADVYLPRQADFDTQYHAGTIAFSDYLAFTLAPLRGRPLAQIRTWQTAFGERFLPQAFYRQALARLEQHRSDGHSLLLVTATNRIFAEPIAEFLRVDGLLASEVEIDGDRCSGLPRGEPCYAGGKRDHFDRWLRETGRGGESTWFYSDSHNDLPLLRKVDNPVAVNADPRLRREATRAGWPLLDFDA